MRRARRCEAEHVQHLVHRQIFEIRALKGKLMGIGMGLAGAGRWLAEKIDAAWERESVLLTPELVDAAWPRFQTIVTDGRGSREMELIGKPEFYTPIYCTPVAANGSLYVTTQSHIFAIGQ